MGRNGLDIASIINYRLLAKALGVLTLGLSATMVLPLVWSIWLNSGDTLDFLTSMVLLAIPGYLLSRLKTTGTMRLREALLVVTLGWIVCAAASTLPFVLSGAIPRFIDAMFETMSGLTTTGATVMRGLESQPAGVLYWRSLLHWLGGLGIIVIALAVFPQIGLGATQLYQAEVPGPSKQRILPKVRETAKVLLWIYLALSFAQMAALVFAGMSLYESQIHTFGTVATGGFSNRTASVGGFNSPVIEAIIAFFMVAAGVNFTLYYRAVFAGEAGAFRKNPEFRWYLTILGVATAIIALSIGGRLGWFEAIRRAAFQVASIMTTTGFVTADYEQWPEIARLVLLLLMFVGACAGSTGGAMKVSRLVIIGKHLYREVLRTIHPSAVLPISVGGEVVPERTIRQVSAFIGLYLASFVCATLYMSYLGLDLASATSSVAATLGNIGPGLGVVGPTTDYAMIPPSGKVVLTLMMLLGRLEVFTVLAVLTPAFWRR